MSYQIKIIIFQNVTEARLIKYRMNRWRIFFAKNYVHIYNDLYMYVKLNIYYIHLKYWIILSKYIHTKTTNTAEKTNKCSPQECLHVYTQRWSQSIALFTKGSYFIWSFIFGTIVLIISITWSGISVKRTSVKNLKSFKNPVCLLNKCSLFCYHYSWNLTYKRWNFPGNEYYNWYFILLSGFIVNIFCKMLWIIT